MGSDCWDAARFAATKDCRLQLREDLDCCSTKRSFSGFPGGLKTFRDSLFCIAGCYHRCARCASALWCAGLKGADVPSQMRKDRTLGSAGADAQPSLTPLAVAS